MEVPNQKQYLQGKENALERLKSKKIDLPGYEGIYLHYEDLVACYGILHTVITNQTKKPLRIDTINFWKMIDSILDYYPTFSEFEKSTDAKKVGKPFIYVMQYAYGARLYNPKEVFTLSKSQELYLTKLISEWNQPK
jgi:hypothetical protein